MRIMPNPNYRPPVDRAAFEALTDRIEVQKTDLSLADIRVALPAASFLADALDDFLPGHQSQSLTAKLQPTADGGWRLSTHVSIMDDTSERFFDAQGNFTHWG
jgi:hypothetical protein